MKKKKKEKTRSLRSSCFFSQKRNLSFLLSSEEIKKKRGKRKKERKSRNNRINIWSVTRRNGGKFEIRDGMKNHLRTSPSAAARTPVSHGMFIMQGASMGESKNESAFHSRRSQRGRESRRRFRQKPAS